MARTRKRKKLQTPQDEVRDQSAPLEEGAAREEEAAGEESAFASFGLPDGEEDEKPTREELLDREERRHARRRRKKIVRRIVWAVVILFLLAVIAACAAFAAYRWYIWDDEADFCGTWRIVGTEKQVEITEDTIVLTDDVTYKYTIDPQAKTITFKFGNMVGHARYRFSLNRQLLSITDGEYDLWGTLNDDLSWTVAALFTELVQNGAQLSPGQGPLTTELTRDLDPSSDAVATEGGSAGEGAEGGSPSAAGEEAAGADGAAAPEGAEGAEGEAASSASSEAQQSGASSAGSSAAGSSSMRDVDSLGISDIAAGG